MSNDKILNNRCKNCGSELLFNPTSRCLSCKHCDSTIAIKENHVPSKKEYSKDIEAESFKSKQYKCNSCGNHYIIEYSDMTKCPNCGSSEFKQMMSTEFKPDTIIPFKITRREASFNFKEWIKTRRFAPSKIVKYAKNEKLSPCYIPVWDFDYKSIINFSGTGECDYKDSDGDSHTSYYRFSDSTIKRRNYFYISANKFIDNNTIRNLEYNPSDMVAFNPAYFFGWSVINNNVNLHSAESQMQTESKILDDNEIKKEVRENNNYDRISNYRSTAQYSTVKYELGYYPLWINYYKYKNKTYHSYINGYNGKVDGNFPKSLPKILLFILAILSPFLLIILLAILF